MAKFTRLEVAQTMANTGFVPLFYNSDIEIGKKVIAACYRGGARLLEFTNRGDYAHEVFGVLNKYCLEHYPEMIMGVGSVTDAAAASLYMQLGANFVVISKDIIKNGDYELLEKTTKKAATIIQSLKSSKS